MSPFDSMWFTFGVPAGALLFAFGSYLWLRHRGHEFDRKYGKHDGHAL